MHIKFLKHGTGSTKKAVNYLTRAIDHKGKIRPEVKVLRGNPSLIAELGEGITFKHKYRSAVIAFAPGDRIDQERKNEVLNEFERLAFAGLEGNQYTYLAIDHGDHIHIIAPRIELTTGRSMNIAPPGWQKTYDVLRDYFNTKYNWKSPDIEANPQNKRVANIENLDLPKDVKKAKELINNAVLAAIEQGVIKNHSDTKAYLAKIGEITREGKDYISIKPKGFKKAIRLKGAIYEKEFDTRRIRGNYREGKSRGNQEIHTDREREVARLRRELERVINKRAKYNRNRYRTLPRENNQENRSNQQQIENSTNKSRQSEQANNIQQSEAFASANFSWYVSNNWGTIWNNTNWQGSELLFLKNYRSQRGASENSRASGSTETAQEYIYQEILGGWNRTRERANNTLEYEASTLDSRVQIKDINDRNRDSIKRSIEDARRDIQRGIDKYLEELRAEFKANRKQLRRANERSYKYHRTAEPTIRAIQSNIGQSKARARQGLFEAIARTIKEAGRVSAGFGKHNEKIKEYAKRILGDINRSIEIRLDKKRRLKAQKRDRYYDRGFSL